MDQTWEVLAEQDFVARTSEDACAPDEGRGEAIATELKTQAKVLEQLPAPSPPKPSESVANEMPKNANLAPGDAPSSLRRLKQVEPDVALGIEKECGVTLARGVDVFRLVMPNLFSSVQTQTRVLLVNVGEAFICEEPISEAPEEVPEELDASQGSSPSSPTAKCSEPASLAAGRVAEDAGDGSNGWIEAELRYFRAAPKRGSLAQRLGRVPTLHVMLSSDDGIHQGMEFVGVHQRRYCPELSPSDAISKHLTESLLQVAFEFIFHPSRTRYTKERVTIRECSVDAEAVQSRELLLPRMGDELRRVNSKIKDVRLEFQETQSAARLPCRNSGASKDKSFLVLDEDVLKVAPAKEQLSSAPPTKGSFRGLGKGFLKTEKARRTGLGGSQKAPGAATSSSASSFSPGPASSSSGAAGAAASTHSAPSIPEGERTRIYHREDTAEARPPPVGTTASEKQQLLLPAAEPPPGEAEVRAMASALREAPKSGANDEEENEDLDEGPADLTELANQLFGLDLDDIDGESSQRTESTEIGSTASPQGASSRDGGAPSEQSEAASEVQPAAAAPPSGVRLLQQRRREREAQSAATTGQGSSSSAAAASSSRAPAVSNNPDDLVALWMKQRW